MSRSKGRRTRLLEGSDSFFNDGDTDGRRREVDDVLNSTDRLEEDDFLLFLRFDDELLDDDDDDFLEDPPDDVTFRLFLRRFLPMPSSSSSSDQSPYPYLRANSKTPVELAA